MRPPMSAPPAAAPPPPPPMAYGPPMMPVQKTAIPIVGGALLIIAGILAIILWGALIALGSAFGAGLGLVDPAAGGLLSGIILICGSIGVILSIFTLVGGVMAVQRKMWGLALTGAILGIFTIGLYALSSILSIVGLILIAVARKEFA